jgi:hypothetical protein
MSDPNSPESHPVNPGPPPGQGAPPPQQPPQNWTQPVQQYRPTPPGGVMQSIIPTSNPASLVSYYCGIFSLTTVFAPILSPIAIIYGVKAMKRIKAEPGLKGYGHALAGIILGSITGLIALVIIGALVYGAATQPDTGPIQRPVPKAHSAKA